MELAGARFADPVELFEAVAPILTRTPAGAEGPPSEAQLITDLVRKGHPQGQKKLGQSGVQGVEVRWHPDHPRSKSFFLVRRDGTSEDFSYRKCINNLFRERARLGAMGFARELTEQDIAGLLKRSTDPDDILYLIEQRLDAFSPRLDVLALYFLSKVGPRRYRASNLATMLHRDPRFVRLHAKLMADFGAPDCAFGLDEALNVFSSYGRLGFKPEPAFVASVQRQVLDRLEDCTPHQITGLLMAMVRMKAPQDPAVFEPVLGRARATLEGFSHSDLSNFLFACKQLQCTELPGAEEWLREVEREISFKVDTFTGDSAARALRSFASMRYRPSNQTLQNLANRLVLSNTKSHPGVLATAMWSLGVLGFNPGRDVVAHLLDQAEAGMDKYLPKEKTKFMWGLASLKAPPTDSFLTALEDSVAHELDRFSIFDLVTILWSYSMLKMAVEETVMESIFGRIKGEVPSLTLVGLLNTLYSAVTLMYEDDELIEALLAELEGRAGQLKSHHYAKVFHQLHKIDHPPTASFTAAMVEEVTRGAHLLSGSLVRNVLTACAGLDIEPGDAFLAAVKARHAEVLEEFRFVPWLNDALQAYSELLEFPLGLIPEDYDAKVELLRKIVQDEAELF